MIALLPAAITEVMAVSRRATAPNLGVLQNP